MQRHTLPSQLGRAIEIDLCEPCQSFWFDKHESLQLSPAATLSLFRLIGERATRPQWRDGDIAKCPRCKAQLRRTHDMQRATRFEYLKCPHDHGRLMSFFEFLKAKDFIKPLSAKQIAALREHIQIVNCSNCGAPIDLAKDALCGHCGAPLSMLDLEHAGQVVEQLREAAKKPVDPTLPLHLAQARAEVEAALKDFPREREWYVDAASSGLVGAGLHVVARWLRDS
jgi:hypothetical protein